MKQKKEKGDAIDDVIWKAAIAAIIVGLLVTAYLIIETRKESYSALYLKPDSYSNYLEGTATKFTYGVSSYETKRTLYTLKVYLGETEVTGKEFTLDPGQTAEDAISLEVPENTPLPVKVKLTLTGNGEEYSTHYWIKERK
ncbi:MAG: hypothetical protein JW724_01920 [Candidatus Altiarchaeota archaeon]|nr:hypothetical protein [Candidatus Altiarchaeota archaeon]